MKYLIQQLLQIIAVLILSGICFQCGYSRERTAHQKELTHLLDEKEDYRKEITTLRTEHYIAAFRRDGWQGPHYRLNGEPHFTLTDCLEEFSTLKKLDFTFDVDYFSQQHPKYGYEYLFVIMVANYNTDDDESDADAIPVKPAIPRSYP